MLGQTPRLHRHTLAGSHEIGTFRNLVLHVAARITRGDRQTRVRIDQAWKHADAIAHGWLKIRAAFT